MIYAKVEFETTQNTARQSERKQKQKKQEVDLARVSTHENADELWDRLD